MLKTNENLWCYIDSNDYASEYFFSKEEALNDWLKIARMRIPML